MLDLAALKAELELDPLALGYDPQEDGSRDQACADLCNLVRPETTIDRAQVPTADLVSVVALGAYQVLAEPDRAWLELLCLPAYVVPSPTVKGGLASLFPAGDPLAESTGQALQALLVQVTSRAVQLFGVPITPSDVANARRS